MTWSSENAHANIVAAMAKLLWGLSWADAMEESGRSSELSGKNIFDVMPAVPNLATRFANKLAEELIVINEEPLLLLVDAALAADGLSSKLNQEQYDDYCVRFGECLVYGALGHGVSWFDDHEEFELKLDGTNAESYAFELQALADRDC